MKTIIAGSREITDYVTVKNCIELAIKKHGFKITHVISGGAEGVDFLGIKWAQAHDISFHTVRPKYHLFRGREREAPKARNTEMAKQAEALIAIWDGTSGGTYDMIQKAKDAGLKIKVFTL